MNSKFLSNTAKRIRPVLKEFHGGKFLSPPVMPTYFCINLYINSECSGLMQRRQKIGLEVSWTEFGPWIDLCLISSTFIAGPFINLVALKNACIFKIRGVSHLVQIR